MQSIGSNRISNPTYSLMSMERASSFGKTQEGFGFGGFCGRTNSNFQIKNHPSKPSLTPNRLPNLKKALLATSNFEAAAGEIKRNSALKSMLHDNFST